MTNQEKNLELLALKDSFESGAITAKDYTDGITHIVTLPEKAPFSATKNLGLKLFQDRVEVGKCKIPITDENRSRKLRVATFLKDNPEEEKGQRIHYEN